VFAFGIILLELDNAATFDFSKVSNEEFEKVLDGNIFENYPLNRSSAIYEIAKIFLSKSPRDRESAHTMLLKLLARSKDYQRIRLFSIAVKGQELNLMY